MLHRRRQRRSRAGEWVQHNAARRTEGLHEELSERFGKRCLVLMSQLATKIRSPNLAINHVARIGNRRRIVSLELPAAPWAPRASAVCPPAGRQTEAQYEDE